ncbi:MAG: hypothetical protein VX466_04970 [Myxococcota bacterium]|nr:hypothetical protein [Myxococcota bacterium]
MSLQIERIPTFQDNYTYLVICEATREAAVIDRVRKEEHFEAKKNPLCNWCEFKSVCPAWHPDAQPPQPRSAPQQASTAPKQLPLL